MNNHHPNRKWNRTLLIIAALAVTFLSACGNSSDIQPTEGISSEVSSTTSETVSSSSDSDQSASSSDDGQQDITTDSQLPDDGKLRVADSPADNGGTTVFCGNQIVYDGDGTASAFDGDEYFYVRRIVGNEYRSTVYNRDGEQLLEVPGGYPQLAGKWLISGGDMYGAPETTVVYDMETLQQRVLDSGEGRSQFCFEADGYICATTNDYGATDTTIYNGKDLSVAARFPGFPPFPSVS